ncbi:MAG: DNA mismatch repair protein MutS, partial [Ruminococcaceae bacterium]|nr:DNA mismatch repair protein MutS [Oscillospiraceae bacterium]
MGELSPMMKQYLEIKQSNPDALLFFRLGDFYEMFFDDAKTASEELQLTLTGRDCGLEERAPMCGVPFHSYEGYVAKLVAKGYKVAICEQMEDPATAKGLVKRGVIRVITPGTVVETSMLDDARNNYICSVCRGQQNTGVCFADVSTGEARMTELPAGDIALLMDEMARFSPREVLISEGMLSFGSLAEFIKNRLQATVELLPDDAFETEKARGLAEEHFTDWSLTGEEIMEHPDALGALGALLQYIDRTQLSGAKRLADLEYYVGEQFMRLDMTARRNLELCANMRTKEKQGTLLWVLDRTRTSMGKRELRRWIEQPLRSPLKIHARLDAVEELCREEVLRGELSVIMGEIGDIERLMTKVVYGTANPRDMLALAFSLNRLPFVKGIMERMESSMMRRLCSQLDTLEDVASLIEDCVDEQAPATVREGNIVRIGYNEEVDNLRRDRDGGRGFLAQIEAQERERTGIPKLKVGYNRVFGYYIEVSNSYKAQVPEDYIRKQTLANGERYITQELKEIESRVLGAQERLVRLEYEIFEQLREAVAAAMDRVQQSARAIAAIDVLYSLANVAVARRYVRPQVNNSGRIVLTESRHPVVEALLKDPFVPNDVILDNGENRIAIITGPNMAGKSTYMRQVALIVLMAQMGSFVPAQSAEIGVVDGIYTRVGASDDLATGQSTFMLEMNEVAEILRSATKDSLIIFDEIGRGTSTFDGMSIARGVLEYTADRRKLGAKTLFATHYHELTVMEDSVSCVKNYNIAAKKHGDDI